MHTVELIEGGLAVLRQLGYAVRQEWLGGIGAGGCEIQGRKVFYVDLSLGPLEQLEEVIGALEYEAAEQSLALAPALRELLESRRAA